MIMETKLTIEEKIEILKQKYAATGQDYNSYIDGLIYSDYLNYWDYIHLDTLLTLQKPRTKFPDEKIFIAYHQITELYFNLILHEINQLCDKAPLDLKEFLMRMKRINNYFQHLVHSFDIMIDGMEPEQFLKFRMALLPASGFQSGQYRLIEISSTDVVNLTSSTKRAEAAGKSIEEQMAFLYWRQGATELKTGSKTFTLRQFEEKYDATFTERAIEFKDKNILRKYLSLSEDDKKNPELIESLRKFDLLVNVDWPLIHMRSASRYLHRKPEDIAATGGTNWQKYLPPKIRRVSFFPFLFTEEELENWGAKMSH
jgi:tryptophan 2,3-dioxygenase